ncbi:protein halfway-like [Eriocheir sinensis]|uniref:protein halfway-like n=1 Tax=Eriocheir sinensis TaxID=95602 RepID=UPI0021C647C5|nr:protein halfway-like [Eriocheir sinensis]
MNHCVYLCVVLAAGAVTVSGIDVKVLRTILKWRTDCQPPQPLKDSHLVHVECQGLAALQDVKQLLDEEMWLRLGSLTIINSYLTTNLTLDDLVHYPALHTLTLKRSRLTEWKKSHPSPLPRVKKLVVEQCWDNDTFLAKPEQLTLKLGPELQNALPHLEELYLIDNYMMALVAEPTAMKNLSRFVIKDGAAKCEAENIWVREWYDAGKVEVNSTVCFVEDMSRVGLDAMNIQFTFVGLEFIQVMKYVKSTVEDCPASCTCEVNGFRDDTPIADVDCSSANLTQLPDFIPSHTKRLFITNNRITNISKIFTAPTYQNLDQIMLDNNHIAHVDGDLLYNYIRYRSLDFKMSLANNKLETLPVKHLEKIYTEGTTEGHNHLPVFNLTGNPWNCDDCAFLVPFQNMIYYQFLQKEFLKEIRCGEGRYAEGQQIIMLPVRSYCKEKPPLEPLDILNICLGILLFLFILNFLHNFVQYQRHGKLPWIVNKLPCC